MKNSLGFTLVEIAVVLVILAVIMSALFFPLTMRVDHKRMKATQERLEEIKEALLGFAILNDSLPCPAKCGRADPQDTNCDDEQEYKDAGKEDSTLCNQEGYLPWVELGVGRYDAWGNPFRYRVYASFTNSPFPDPPDTSNELVVQDRKTPTHTPINLVEPDGIIAIIFSYSKDGEPNKENDTIDQTYTQDVYVKNTFDDMLIWLPKSILINRLAEAGKWPPP